MKLSPHMGSGRRACLSVSCVLLSFTSCSCEFSISDLLSLRAGLGDMSLPADWGQTINSSFFAPMHFGISSGKENASDTVLFSERFFCFNLVKLNRSCEKGRTKSKLFKPKCKEFRFPLTPYQKRHIEGDGFTHHFECLPVIFLRWRVCAALRQ